MAKILILEDELFFTRLLSEHLTTYGHEILGVVKNRKEYDQLLKSRGQIPQIITIDGDLQDFNTEASIPMLRKRFPWVYLIGLSKVELSGVDINITKYNYPSLGSIITRKFPGPVRV